MDETLSHIHRFEKGAEASARPLLLLHGTGGDENDLVSLARKIAPTSPLLSPRGKVLENGMPRFFRRLAEGVFDEDDVRRRAQETMTDKCTIVIERQPDGKMRALERKKFSNGWR